MTISVSQAVSEKPGQPVGPPAARSWRPHPSALVLLLALVPLLVTVSLVRDSSQLQWLDYWSTIPRFTHPDGALDPGGLFFFHEGHVPAVGSLIFWVNLHLTGGLAHPVGYYDVVVVVAQLLVLRSMLPSRTALGPWTHAFLVVAIAVLLFAPQGAWNFSRSASGASWLTANLFTIAGLALAVRGRLLWAALFAALASITYGTGLAAWPAILLVCVLRRDWSWRNWAFVGAGALTIGTYVLRYKHPASQSSVGFDPNDSVHRLLQVLGSALSPDAEIAPIIGAIGVGLAGYLAVACWRTAELRRPALPWIGLGAWAILASAMVGAARGGINPADIGVASRYASLSILLWVSVLVLAVVRLNPDPRLWFAGFVLSALAFAGGQPSLAALRASTLQQNELAIAMRLGVSDGYPMAPNPARLPFYRSLHHFPYSSDFHSDCGLLGKRIDTSSAVKPSLGSRGQLDRFEPAYNNRSVRLAGWYGSRDGAIRCVVVVDQDNRVIGAASTGYERPDVVAVGSPTGNFDVGFIAVAPAGAKSYRAYAVLSGRKPLYEVPGELASPK